MPVLLILSLLMLTTAFFMWIDSDKTKEQPESRPSRPLPKGREDRGYQTRTYRPLPPRTAPHMYGAPKTNILYYPRCPYDHQRNVRGQKQLIFYDMQEDCYRCSRGHRFQKNGMPF